ncbi:MAG: class I SAM-dependent methyltransferase [Acidimicrobiales bacterium]
MTSSRLLGGAYDLLMSPVERAGLSERRERLLAGVSGRVLEVGGGTGRNLIHYRPGAVTELVVLEPDASMRHRLLVRAAGSPVPVEVHDCLLDDCMDAAGLAPASFDYVVSTLVLCSVPDQHTALRSIKVLLKPGGSLVFLEHVRSTGWRAGLQALLTPAWSRVGHGCHLDRDTLASVHHAGFTVEDWRSFDIPFGGPLVGAGVQGVAVNRV